MRFPLNFTVAITMTDEPARQHSDNIPYRTLGTFEGISLKNLKASEGKPGMGGNTLQFKYSRVFNANMKRTGYFLHFQSPSKAPPASPWGGGRGVASLRKQFYRVAPVYVPADWDMRANAHKPDQNC